MNQIYVISNEAGRSSAERYRGAPDPIQHAARLDVRFVTFEQGFLLLKDLQGPGLT